MGAKSTKVILPLLAIGGLAAMTGGFGLFGAAGTAGAGAGAGAAAGGAAAGGAAAGATAAGAVAAETGAALTVEGLAGMEAAAGWTAAEPFAAGAGEALTADMAAAWGAPSSGFFSNLVGASGSGAALTYGEAGGLGMAAGGAALNAGNAAEAGQTQAAMLEQQRLASELQAETRERDSQSQLRQVLAAQDVMFGARGQNPGSPTALRLSSAAEAGAADDSQVIRSQQLMEQAGNGLQMAALRRSTRGQVLGAGLQFGRDSWSILSGRRGIGG